MNPTPVSLLEKLKSSDHADAWPRFVELYTPLLHSWAQESDMFGADAEDVVQNVFVKLLKKLPSFEYNSSGSFRAWLRKMFTNTRLEKYRRKFPKLADDEVGWPEPQTLENGPDDVAEQEYHAYLVGRSLQIMQRDFEPPTWKAVWEFIVEGRSALDIARELGIKRQDVYSANYRVLRRLRAELDGFW